MVKFNGVAMVIAIREYVFINTIKSTVTDSSDMRRELVKCGYDVAYIENPTRSEIVDELKRTRDKISKFKYREVIIYYAGQGAYHGKTQYMMLPEFGNPNTPLSHQIANYGFSVEDMLNILQSTRPDVLEVRSIVVILDTSREVLPYADVTGNTAQCEFINPTRTEFKLSRDARTGILVAYACERGHGVQCGRPGENGVYTKHLLEHIFIPGNPIIDALGKVHQLIVHKTGGGQKPYMRVDFPNLFNFPLNKGVVKLERSKSCNDLAVRKSLFYTKSSQKYSGKEIMHINN